MNFKDFKETFHYLTNGYRYDLEDVVTKNGIQKRIKNFGKLEKIEMLLEEKLKFENIMVSLKLGPQYNRTTSPWIMLNTYENQSGTKGRYCGISFNSELQEVNMWIRIWMYRKTNRSTNN